jgi:hypothetical protein
MKLSRVCCAIGLLFLFACDVDAAQGREEELVNTKPGKALPFSVIRGTPGLISLTFIGAEREHLVIARRMLRLKNGQHQGLEPPWAEAPDSDTPVGYILEFYRRDGNNFQRIAESNPGFILSGMTAVEGRGAAQLVTTWVTGTASAMIIFALRSDRVAKVFSWAGKMEPEFAGLANDGELYLVVTDGEIVGVGGRTIYPETASVYAWEGSRYVLRTKVPWEKRFDALKSRWPNHYPKE